MLHSHNICVVLTIIFFCMITVTFIKIRKLTFGREEGRKLINYISLSPKYLDLRIRSCVQHSGGTFVWKFFHNGSSHIRWRRDRSCHLIVCMKHHSKRLQRCNGSNGMLRSEGNKLQKPGAYCEPCSSGSQWCLFRSESNLTNTSRVLHGSQPYHSTCHWFFVVY